jgi:hypothetical protein
MHETSYKLLNPTTYAHEWVEKAEFIISPSMNDITEILLKVALNTI